MTKILALGVSPWDKAPARVRRLSGALRGCALLYAQPGGSWKGLRLTYTAEQNGGITLLSPQGKTAAWRESGPLASWLQHRQSTVLSAYLTEDKNPGSLTVWCFEPVRPEVLSRLPRHKLVYEAQAQHNAGRMEQCAALADAVVAADAATAQALKHHRSKLCYLPDGADLEHFSAVEDPLLPCPQDMFRIQEPILGHIGQLREQAEWGYIEAAAGAHPDWNFVVLGDKTVPDKIPGNVHFLGEKPWGDLPAYLMHFNACFRVEGGGAEEDLPAALFACFASGKPVVTTLYPKRVLEYTDVVYLAHSPETFTEGCRRALYERDAWRKKERVNFAKATSWEARGTQFEAFLRGMDVL